jgi:flavin-dependent dehydrogenase
VGSCNVVVVGAGPAGSTCAALLATAGIDVLLVEAGDFSQSRPAEVLAPVTVRLLSKLGLPWPQKGCGAVACRGILSVWSSPKPEFFDYELYTCSPGVTVDRRIFDLDLAASAVATKARLIKGGRLRRAEICSRDRWHLLIEQAGRVISVHTDFLVEAVGRKGSSSALSGRARTFYDRLVAVMIPHVGPAADDGLLLLEAGRHGWWYSSRDDREATSLVYLTDADLLPPGSVARTQHLKDAYASTRLIQDLLGPAPDFQAHRVIDARTSRRTVIGNRWLAVGDAAFANDPLSGSGIRFALLSAEKASRAVAAFLQDDKPQLFEEYATWFASEVASQLQSKQNVYRSVRSELRRSMFWNRRLNKGDKSCLTELEKR